MNYSFFYFLSSPIVPEMTSDVAACATSDIHLMLVSIPTTWTIPFHIVINLDFSIETAYLAIIRFNIKFSIHNMIINKSHNLFNSLDVLGQIRTFNITYCQSPLACSFSSTIFSNVYFCSAERFLVNSSFFCCSVELANSLKTSFSA